MTLTTPPADRLTSPERWHREICWVHGRLIVTGDLDEDVLAAIRQLRDWVAAGVTHIVDVRVEANDAELVAEYVPGLQRARVGFERHLGARCQPRALIEPLQYRVDGRRAPE